MPAIVLIGAQWGDEGKGKATDLLGDSVQYVVRYQGGNNAGHTVVIGEEKYALHVLPSGVLSPTVTPVIGNGVVIDPKVLFEEVDALEEHGRAVVERLPKDEAGVGDVRAHPLAVGEVVVRDLPGLDAAPVVDLGEQLVLVPQGEFKLLPEDARVE